MLWLHGISQFPTAKAIYFKLSDRLAVTEQPYSGLKENVEKMHRYLEIFQINDAGCSGGQVGFK